MRIKLFLSMLLLTSLLFNSAAAKIQIEESISTNCEITQKDYFINFSINSCEYNANTFEIVSNISSEPYPWTKKIMQMKQNGESVKKIWIYAKKWLFPRYEQKSYDIITGQTIDTLKSNLTHIVYKNTYKRINYQEVAYAPEWCTIEKTPLENGYYNETAKCPQIKLNSLNLTFKVDDLKDYPLKNERGLAGKSKKLDYFQAGNQEFELRQLPLGYDAKTHIGSDSAVITSTVGSQVNISNGFYKWSWDTSTDTGAFWWYNGNTWKKSFLRTNAVGSTSSVSAYGDDESYALNVSDIAGTGQWFSLNLTRGMHARIQSFSDSITPSYFNFSYTDLVPTHAWIPGSNYYDSGDNVNQYLDMNGNNWVIIWNSNDALHFSFTDNNDHAEDDIDTDFVNGYSAFWIDGNPTNEQVIVNWLNSSQTDFNTNSDNPTTANSGKPFYFYELINDTFPSGTQANTTLWLNSQTRCPLNLTTGANGLVLNNTVGTPCYTLQLANASKTFSIKYRGIYPRNDIGTVPIHGLRPSEFGTTPSIQISYNTDSNVKCEFTLNNGTIISQDISPYITANTWADYEIKYQNSTNQEIWIDGSQRCKNNLNGITMSAQFITVGASASHFLVDWITVPREVIPDMIDSQGGTYQGFDFFNAGIGVNKSLGDYFGKSALLDVETTHQANRTVNTTGGLITNDFYTISDISLGNIFQITNISSYQIQNYNLIPGYNLSQGIEGTTDLFFISNITAESVFTALSDPIITLDDPKNFTYFTNNMTFNFTITTIEQAGALCWSSINSAGYTYLGNITNGSRTVSYTINNNTAKNEAKITCQNNDGINASTAIQFYTQDLYKIWREKFYTGDFLEGNSSVYETKWLVNSDLLENVNASFWYAGIKYAWDKMLSVASGLITGGTNYTFNRTHNVPLIDSYNTTIGYNWTITGAYRINGSLVPNSTANHTVTIHAVELAGCNVFPTKVMNFTVADEKDESIINSSIDLTITANLPNSSTKEINISFTNDSYFHEICIYPNWANYTTNSKLEFADGTKGVYARRNFYVINTFLNNASVKKVPMYLLLKTDAVAQKVTVLGASGKPQEDLIVKLQRFYPQFNLFRDVQIGKTDTNGEIAFYVEPSDLGGYAEYYYIVQNDSAQLKKFGGTTIDSGAPDLTIRLAEAVDIAFTESFGTVIATYNLNTNTNVTSITFTSTSGAAEGYRFTVSQVNITNEVILCDQNTTATGATFTCPLGNLDDNYFLIRGFVNDSSGKWYQIIQREITGDASFQPAFLGILAAIIIFSLTTFGLLVMNEPIPPLIGGFMGLLIIGLFGLVPAAGFVTSIGGLYFIALFLISYNKGGGIR